MVEHILRGCSFARVIVAVFLFIFMAGVVAHAEVATVAEMHQVCQNWLTREVAFTGSWAGESNPQIIASHDIVSGDTVVARWYDISPRGFVLVPVLKEMSPVKMYSDETNLDSLQEGGMIAMVRESFSLLYSQYVARIGSLEAPQPAGDAVFGHGHRANWDELTVSSEQFNAGLSARRMPLTQVGPLTTTLWSQGAPYNNLCPMGNGGRTVVGCVATAAAQILRYWQWPASGTGTHTYTWGGDYSCSGSTPGATLSVDCSDPYDWANMPNSCAGTCNSTQQAALAELSYEVGVTFNMDYGKCASGAYTSIAPQVFTSHYKFAPDARNEYRANYDLAGWFSLIQEEINANRVIMYTISRHAIVCDGWRDTNGKPEFHMNYGWGGSSSAWYVLDSLYCYWEPGNVCPASIESMAIHLHPRDVPALEQASTSVTETAGDGDGHAEAGETVNLNVTLTNQGMDATGISATLATTDPYVTVNTPSSSYSDIIWGADGTSLTPYSLHFSSGCPDPHVVTLELSISAAGGYTSKDTILLFAGNHGGITEDVEAGQGAWIHRAPSGAFADQWHVETQRTHGGTQSWKMGGAGSSTYSNMTDACLISPPFLVPSYPKLSYWQWIGAEILNDTVAWDGAVVQISTDGRSWTQLTPEGGYPYKLVDETDGNFAPNTPCFSNDQNWKQVTFDLSGYTGVVQLMFRFATDGATVDEGWYVDDISVASSSCCVATVGNIDCDPVDGVDIGDLTTLIDNLFMTFNPLCCVPEANCDGDPSNSIDIGDLTKLVDNLFITFSPLSTCQ